MTPLLLGIVGCFLWVPGPDSRDGALWTDVEPTDAPETDGQPADHTLYLIASEAPWGPEASAGMIGDPDWAWGDEFAASRDACSPVRSPAIRDLLPPAADTTFAFVTPAEEVAMERLDENVFLARNWHTSHQPFREAVGLRVTGWPGLADVYAPELLTFPPANWLQVLEPEMARYSAEEIPPAWPNELRVRWALYDEPADAVLIRIYPLIGATSRPSVHCLAADDGEFVVSDADIPDYEAPTVVQVEVSRVKQAERVVDVDGVRQRRLAYARVYAIGEFCVGDCASR